MLHVLTQPKEGYQFKTINKQNYQKIKVHGTPTAKELKKHSSKPIGRVEMGSHLERTHGKAMDYSGKQGLAD